jgi:hypothetical protein
MDSLRKDAQTNEINIPSLAKWKHAGIAYLLQGSTVHHTWWISTANTSVAIQGHHIDTNGDELMVLALLLLLWLSH